MVQSVKETLHHHKDLESNNIQVEIRNTSRKVDTITKRIFFNKELFGLGSLAVGVGDNIKISFGLKRQGTEASEFAPFSVNEYRVLKNGLEKMSGTTSSRNKDEELKQTLAELQAKEPASKSKPKDIVELLTWRAN